MFHGRCPTGTVATTSFVAVSIAETEPERPFEMYGHPKFRTSNYAFIPMPTTGAKEPLWQNKICYGYDLRSVQRKRAYEINLNWLINARDQLGDSIPFIDQRNFFDRLAGTSELRKQLSAGMSAKEIKATWKPGIEQFAKTRQKYLIYN